MNQSRSGLLDTPLQEEELFPADIDFF